MIGKTISHYQITEKLGEGGMGVVYKAEDVMLNRTVALKFLPAGLTRDAEAVQRFMNEAHAASSLDHPNICTIHEIDETEDGKMFIVMTFYEGENLKDRIEEGPLSIEEAVDFSIQIASGLVQAHSQKIVHRDIKPANIMLTHDGTAKILDFGLAKMADIKLTKAGTTLGTLAYMSPEQLHGDEVDERTDVWSLAVVLYEMLGGQLPFKGENEQAIFFNIINEEPKPIDTVRADVPKEIESVLDQALEKAVDVRYQQMAEMLSELKGVAGASDTRFRHHGMGKKRSRPGERGFIQAIVALLVVLLVSSGLYFWRQAEAPIAADALLDRHFIAVLPLANFSQDGKDEYFADGMTDELISSLSKVSGLGVIARTSVMQFKGSSKSIADIGRELSVESVLEGSIRKTEDRLLIKVRLIDTQNQASLWSQDYERETRDVFAIQSDIAKKVAEVLELQLMPEQQRHLDQPATQNPEAYNLYLRGRYQLNKSMDGRIGESTRTAREYFEQAVEVDSGYALAYAGLADSYYWLSGPLPPAEAMPKARAAAKRALELDETLAEAHAALANVIAFYDWDWVAAERKFKRAIELNPNYASAHHFYGNYLVANGRFEQAKIEYNRAHQLDPLSLRIEITGVFPYYFGRQYHEAIKRLRKTIEMEPDFYGPHLYLGWVYEQTGEFSKAIAEFERGGIKGAYLGHVYALAGMEDEAGRCSKR